MNLQDERSLAEFAENVRKQYSVGFVQGFLVGALLAAVMWVGFK